MLAVLAMLAPKRRCAWLRAAPLLSSPPFRSMPFDVPGRDGKAGASTELESVLTVAHRRREGDIPILGNQGTFLFCVDRP